MTRQTLLARLAGKSVWTADSWQEWCAANVEEDFVCKAKTPLGDALETEKRKVKGWVGKKPAQNMSGAKKKRTAFTLERHHKLRHT